MCKPKTPQPPILFLDIDGVLNGAPGTGPEAKFWPELVARLNVVLRETKCDVVISSSWRYLIQPGTMTIFGFWQLLRSHGIVLHGQILGRTRADRTGGEDERGRQILQWLRARKIEGRRFCAVDDMQGGFTGVPIVRTDWRIGLSAANVRQLIRKLRGPRVRL